MTVRNAISSIHVFSTASAASIKSLASCAKLTHHKKGSHLFFDKDVIKRIYFLVDGSALLYKISGEHEKKVIFICKSGFSLNEEVFDEKPSSTNCEFLTSSHVLSFDRASLVSICKTDFDLTKALMNSMALKIRRMYRQMKNTLTSVRGDKRIAAKLWKLSKDHGVQCDDGIKIDFNLTITRLAELVGSKRETVSRQLKTLTDKGLVMVSKNKFVIPDCDRLKKYFHET